MGKTYSVDRLLELTENLPVTRLPIMQLAWMVTGDYDQERVKAADTSIPVLVYKLPDGKWVTLDGFHRVVKVYTSERRKDISVKIVPESIFQQL